MRVVGLDAQPWRAVALAAGFAAIVFFGVSIVLRKVGAAAATAGPPPEVPT